MFKIKKYIYVFFTIIFFAGCVTSPLSQEEDQVLQIYKEIPECNKIGQVTEQNWWDGSFKDVKNRIKKSVKAKGGNSFMIDSVSGMRKVTTAFVYLCNK